MADKTFFRELIDIAESIEEINDTMFAGAFEANLEADKIKEDNFPLCIINNALDITNDEGETGIVTRNIPFAVSFLSLDGVDSTASQQQDILDEMEIIADKFVGAVKASHFIPPDQTDVFTSWKYNNQVKIYDATLTGIIVRGTVPFNLGKCIIP